MSQKKNWKYVLAWTLIALLVAITLFGSYIMPHQLGAEHKIVFLNAYEGAKKLSPPLKPNSTFLLGTDHRGYDMISLILNGMKYTLGLGLLITACRFFIGLPLGLLAGASGRGRDLLKTMQWLTTSVPALLLIFPLLYGLFFGLALDTGLPADHPNIKLFSIIFMFAAVFIGTFSIAGQFAERAAFYSDKMFVISSKLMGASLWRIVFRHILPNIRSEISFAFLTEYVGVLFLMGQLAVLGIFVGGGEKVALDDVGYDMITLTTTGEWMALISYGAIKIRNYPWIILSVGAAFTISVWIVQFFLSEMKKRHMPISR